MSNDMITEFNPNTFILKDIFKLYKQDINKIDEFLNKKIPGNYIRFTTKRGKKIEKKIDRTWITYKYQVLFIKNNKSVSRILKREPYEKEYFWDVSVNDAITIIEDRFRELDPYGEEEWDI